MGLGRVKWKINEYSREGSGFSVAITELVAANIAAQTTLITNLRSALGNIILGVVADQTVTSSTANISNLLAASVNAQRERKWLVQYEDSTQWADAPDNSIANPGYHKKFTAEIPTADLSLLLTRSDTVDAADPDLGTELAAFITAFEALVRSPYNGAVNVLQFTAVGRNL